MEIKSDYELRQEFYEAERDWQLVEVERVFGELFIVSLPHGSSRLQGRLHQFIGRVVGEHIHPGSPLREEVCSQSRYTRGWLSRCPVRPAQTP